VLLRQIGELFGSVTVAGASGFSENVNRLAADCQFGYDICIVVSQFPAG
jgi:hypothetical protein